MPKYEIWWSIEDERVATFDVPTLEHAMVMIYDNPQSEFDGMDLVRQTINIEHYVEVADD